MNHRQHHIYHAPDEEYPVPCLAQIAGEHLHIAGQHNEHSHAYHRGQIVEKQTHIDPGRTLRTAELVIEHIVDGRVVHPSA